MSSILLLALFACKEELPPGQCENADLIETFVDADADGFGDPSTRELVCQLSDGLVTNKEDCDDQRSQVYPGALELCDGIDNDCDGAVDDGLRELEYYEDLDGDGFGNFDEKTEACTPPAGYVENRLDCDDLNGLINPGVREICNGGTDDDCNGKADDEDPTLDRSTATVWYYDLDDDGFGGLEPLPFPQEAIDQFQMTNPTQRCTRPVKPAQFANLPGNYVGNVDDCDDTNPLVSPNGTEVCNLMDDDCDQLVDDSDPDLDPSEKLVFWADDDRDGAGDASRPVEACFQPWFTATDASDCDDANDFLQEATGWWIDGDGDGYGAGALSADSCTPPSADHVLPAYGEDCNDASLDEYPGAPEVCDTLDNDCDGLLDVEDPDLDLSSTILVYRDVDGDGFGDRLRPANACPGAVPVGFVTNADDCDDVRDRIFPGAVESCDGIDNDCDGLVDTQDLDVDLATAPEWYLDVDGDGWGNPTLSTVACEQPNLYVGNDLDCDDGDVDVGPQVGWWRDGDGDTFGAGAVSAISCTPPSGEHVPALGDPDCDDTASNVFPGAPDECGDELDTDCNGSDAGERPCISDTCAEADAATPVTALEITVADLGSLEVDHPTFNCISGVSSTGDAVIPVSATTGEVIRARVSHPTDDVYVALVSECSNGSSCQLGSNQLAIGDEQLEFELSKPLDGYVVAGCRTPGGCFDSLIEVEVISQSTWLADECGDLAGHFEYRTGAYSLDGTMGWARDHLNLPSATSCTGYSTSGPEVFLTAVLEDGQRLRGSFDTNSDSAIYLLTTCGSGNTCVDGEDRGDPEELDYRNTSGGVQSLTIGLDCYSQNCNDFTYDMTIQ